MYLAEFAFTGTKELADELLIQAPTEAKAKHFANEYAKNWGIELFSIAPASQQKLRLYTVSPESMHAEVN